jgi:hypothetical protein
MKQILRITFCALLGLILLRSAPAQVAITVGFAPPALPVYEQPVCPGEGFLWVPGYWAWDADFDDYFWVPGTWVTAPQVGLLWTPAWWGWENGGFLFHEGYWATEVGFYGGVNYGFGYFGEGFGGGRWDRDRFMYNRAVVNVNVTNIHNVYEDRTVIINNRTENRVSYNGGEGGITARRTPRDEQVEHERHFPPARPQEQQRQTARSNPQLRASANQGKPPVAATAHAAEFSGQGAVAASEAGAPYHPPANRAGGNNARPGNEARPGSENTQRGGEAARPGENPGAPPTHARDLPPHQPTHLGGGANAPADQKYEKEQEKLAQQQNKEHQKLMQRQQIEDQKQMNQEKKQQTEQRHQQQTQQLEQRHQQQQQHLEQRQPQEKPHPPKPQQ